jgi:hypothetical protein
MRVLQAAVIAMGVLILAGTAAVVAIVVHRASAPRPSTPAAGAAPLVLDEPAGSRIAASALTGERLLLQLSGGGPDRAVVVDLRSGAVLARIGLAR